MSSKKSDQDTSSIEKGAHELEHNATVTLANQKDLDISLALPGMAGVHDDDDLDPAVSRRVKRKLDRRILPLLCLLYTRTSLSLPWLPIPALIFYILYSFIYLIFILPLL